MDVIVLCLAAAFFAAVFAYVGACERL